MTMNFQSIMLLLASVALIGGLAYVGYMFNKLVRARQWPPAISRCPDYFELTGETDASKNLLCADTRGVATPYCQNGGKVTKTTDDGNTVLSCPKGDTLVTPAKKVPALSPSFVRNLPDTERERLRNKMRVQGLTWDGITT